MKLKLVILLALMVALSHLKAQNNLITLSGVILCEDSARGALPSVNIYNKNKKWGTVSDKAGKFSIKMAKNDTIIFSTVQHVEQLYFFKEEQVFEDNSIVISMKQDIVWLKAVDVMGIQNYEEFKSELLQLKLPKNEVALTLPVINKYAKQNYSGEGAFEIKGPLTYLSKKIITIRRRKIKQVKR